MAVKKDLVIVGGGPGGYLAAMRAAQLKRSVALIEQDRIGGTCINYGCIPTKYLLHQTKILMEIGGTKTLEGPVGEIRLDWAKVQRGRQAVVDQLVKGLVFLLEKGRVEIVRASARIRPDRTVAVRSPEGEEHVYEAGAVIVATGSRAAGLPFLQPDGRTVLTSTEALELTAVPRSLLVIGAGAIGLEMGSVYRRLGTDVTVLEILPQILPGSDRETVTRLERALKKQGLKIFTEMRIDAAAVDAGSVTLRGTSLSTGTPFALTAEKALLSAGRAPNTSGLFDGEPFLALDRGFVRVNAALEASAPGFYAIGDVIGGKLLAHKAYHDALVAVENACGLGRTVDYGALPAAVFTEPEFASVGLTQEEAVAKGLKVKSGVFPLQASGRAMTMAATDGLVKVLADETDKVVGAHVVAPGASDMLPVLTMAVAKGMSLRELDSIIYIHPTLSEAIGEAALKANNAALHILNT